MSTELQPVVSAAMPAIETFDTGEIHDLAFLAERGFEELANRVQEMGDEQLAHTIKLATQVGDTVWWVRGACVAEAKRRIRERGAAMQGKKDDVGAGITAAIAKIAADAGCHPRTLEEDCKIVETLQPVLEEHMTVSDAGSETVILLPKGLSREVCGKIAREQDVDRAVRVALEIITPASPAPTAGEFLSALDKVKRKELRLDDGQPAPAATNTTSTTTTKLATNLLAETEHFDIRLHHDVVDKLIFISDSEAHPSISAAIEWCIEQAYAALNRNRQPDRRPGQALDFEIVPTERAA